MFSVGEGILSQVDFLVQLTEIMGRFQLIENNKKIQYYNIPAAFDIETSSWYENGVKEPENKRGCMYIWQFGIYNLVTTGRTWQEFIRFTQVVSRILQLNSKRRLVVYIHNMQFEFQWMHKYFEWDKVFFLDKRRPVYAITGGIEFRCSLKLSGGKGLAGVGKDLIKYKCLKAEEKLDYSKIRTPLTELTTDELYYCENDIRVLECYIQEKIESDGDITQIPLTNTGYVRQYCRKACFSRWKSYHALMKELKVEPSDFSQLNSGFSGGFAHANAHYVRKTLENVGSHDLISSYPAVMCLELFPMSKPYHNVGSLDISTAEKMFLDYNCMMILEIENLVPKLHQDHAMSAHKCNILQGAIIDNGRVVAASYLVTVCTEQDYFVYSQFYTWDRIIIRNLLQYEKAYLPKDFILSILELYKEKTKLKGKEGEEVNYQIKKGMANSAYGMVVTNPVRDEVYYSKELCSLSRPSSLTESIKKYNESGNRFLYYPWGVWVTAYARANLFSAIISMGMDYVFSDTDSVKTLHTNDHADYFERYNQGILDKIKKSSRYLGISESEFSPKTEKGVIKTLGFWDDEGEYTRFKTLGAKRYLVQSTKPDGTTKYSLTVAGTHKEKSMKYMLTKGDPFDLFDDSLVIPSEHSGRLIVTYIDHETDGWVIDDDGTPYHYHELSSVHMEPSDYSLSISRQFDQYLRGVQEIDEVYG